MIESASSRRTWCGLADDDRQLRLVVELRRGPGADQRLIVSHLGVGEASEERGELALAPAGLLTVGDVVHAHAEDLFRVRNGRKPGDLLEGVVGRGALGGP